MVSTFTTARNLEKPAAGDQIGTWGTASINPDLDVIDAGMGQTATYNVSAGSVVLAANQFRCSQLVFSSTLLANTTVTFPTSFTGPYTVLHLASGSSQFTITLTTTAASGQAICCKPGEPFDVFNDGTSLRYRNLGHVGTRWEYVGSSVPNWVSGCTVPPYLNEDGTTFSSATYPQLAALIGTTLPDSRGRVRATLNQGTGRLLSSGGVDGNTNFSGGGATTVLTSAHMPPSPVVITDNGHGHAFQIANGGGDDASGGLQTDQQNQQTVGPSTSFTPAGTFANGQQIAMSLTNISITVGSSLATTFTNVQPTVAIGLTLVRAA